MNAYLNLYRSTYLVSRICSKIIQRERGSGWRHRKYNIGHELVIAEIVFWVVRVCSDAQSCPILCNPMACTQPGSSVHWIFRQEYWNGLPFPSPGDLPHPVIEPGSPSLQVDSFPTEPPGKSYYGYMGIIYCTVLFTLLCAWNFP